MFLTTFPSLEIAETFWGCCHLSASATCQKWHPLDHPQTSYMPKTSCSCTKASSQSNNEQTLSSSSSCLHLCHLSRLPLSVEFFPIIQLGITMLMLFYWMILFTWTLPECKVWQWNVEHWFRSGTYAQSMWSVIQVIPKPHTDSSGSHIKSNS